MAFYRSPADAPDPEEMEALPPERWPYGPPDHHEACCLLHSGARECDCAASSEHQDDTDFGRTA